MRRAADSPGALRSTWLATRAAGSFSVWLGGWFAERLWFTPWRADASWRALARQDKWLEGTTPLAVPFGPIRLAGFEAGSGPTVLLVHGWGERAASLGAFIGPLVANGHRVVGVDLPAHGNSPGRRTDLPEQAAALRAAADHLGGIHGIVAHSMGGFATTMALHDGLHAEAVTLIAPAVSLNGALARFTPMYKIPPRATAGLHAAIERRFGRDAWELFAGDRMAPGLDVPALIVQDRDDPQVDHSEAVALSEAWRGSRLVTTEGLGHMRILRDPEVIAGATDFMSRAPLEAQAS
ncbi:MAG: alpha/beta fold hydrolase [Actinomycetota bacterium]